MKNEFRTPNFTKSNLELRFENNVVCIYGTKEGLKAISELCNDLIENPEQGHIHLENFRNKSVVLTPDSEIGAIAIFN
jgi:hypothetical protein